MHGPYIYVYTLDREHVRTVFEMPNNTTKLFLMQFVHT